jgi:hypothetical protein
VLLLIFVDLAFSSNLLVKISILVTILVTHYRLSFLILGLRLSLGLLLS